MKLILASASPRRKELLAHAGLPAEVRPADADETIDKKNHSPESIVKVLSERKAEACASALLREEKDCGPCVVLGADTVVSHRGEVLGKPSDEADAFRMLESLSGDRNTVFTGVTLLLLSEGTIERRDTFAEATDVWFETLSEEEIRDYIRSGEPMDKAGAYGIQGLFGRYVRRIEGDYANVVGLPVAAVYQHLMRLGAL